jgi:Fic family protein
MSKAIQQIEILRTQLAALLPMKLEDRQRLDKKFRLEFSYNSNHMEGNTLTYHETELLLFFGETKGGHSKQELDEMEAHDVAYKMIQEWADDKERTLTESDIRTLNEVILVKPFWKDAITPDGQTTRRQIQIGIYKTQPNSVRLQNGEMFHYASPAETPMKMGDLMQWYREEEKKKELHPVELAAQFHYKFVCIHPFDDGNGRVSRLLMNYVLLRNSLPPVVIKSVDKKDYLRALNEADAGDWGAFVGYVSEQLLWSLDINVKAAKGETVDEPGDLDKKINSLKRKLQGKEVHTINKEESIHLSIKNSVLPLIKAVQVQLDKFHSLFKHRTEIFRCIKTGISVSEINLEDFINLLDIHYFFDQIEYTLVFEGPKSFSIRNIPIRAEFDVRFTELEYEIVFYSSGPKIKKSYDEIFSKEECQEIAERIGNEMFEAIENATQQ